jgi:octaprenyl-diphosphate synthase
MTILDNIKAPIKDEMKSFEAIFKDSMKSNIPLLNLVTNYLLRRKGKQMRPMFVFLTAKLNGNITSDTYTAASLIELLHTATLVHDDVVDDSNERRGLFSINAIWKSKIAVLMGDYLLTKGLLIAVENKAYDLLEIVSEAVREMIKGELLQIQRSRSFNTTREHYFEIIKMKTATLISACTASGTKSVGSSADIVEQMKLFGEYIGIAFQIKDDILDYQLHGITGKPSGNDIKDKKLTLPLIYALENSSFLEKKSIFIKINKSKKKSANIRPIIDFVTSKGGLDYATAAMHEYKEKALELLNSYPDSDVKTALNDLVNYTIDRKK